MKCTITCFERVLNLVAPLSESKLKGGVEVATEHRFQDLLDYGIKNGCFTKAQADTLYNGIVMWEDLEGDYWEEDQDKLLLLYDKMGITEDVFGKYGTK